MHGSGVFAAVISSTAALIIYCDRADQGFLAVVALAALGPVALFGLVSQAIYLSIYFRLSSAGMRSRIVYLQLAPAFSCLCAFLTPKRARESILMSLLADLAKWNL
jgi:hypothetical protein